MSASSSYQSRLFKWVTQQSHRWAEQWQRTLRHGKTTALWGVQALLFPIYLLVRGSHLGAQRLRQAIIPQPGQLPTGTPASPGITAQARGQVQLESQSPVMDTPRLPMPAVVLPLRRVVQQFMGWMQASPLARRANFFQETVLVKQSPQLETPLLKKSVSSPLSQRSGLPSPLLRAWSQGLLSTINRAVVVLEHPLQYFQGLIPRKRVSVSAHSPTPEVSVPLGQEAFSLRTLIEAAIDYFFGQRLGRNLLPFASRAFPPPARELPEIPSSPSRLGRFKQNSATPATSLKTEDNRHWLTWGDLFGDGVSSKPGSPVSPQSPPHDPARRPPANRSQRIHPAGRRPQNRFPAISSIPGVALGGDGISLEIETQAIFEGYVKHPWQQVLEWLDRGIAWVERWLTVLGSNLRSFIAGLLGLPQKP